MSTGMPARGSSGLWLSLGAAGALAVAGVVAGMTGKRAGSGFGSGRGSRTVIPSRASASRAAHVGRAAGRAVDREILSASDFVFPEDRSYPIPDWRHGQLALTYVAAPSNRMKRYRVMQAVFARYPDLRAWWNETSAGKHDPANVNSWRTTLYEYQALLPRLVASPRMPVSQVQSVRREYAEVEAEIEALRVLSRAPSR